jgi:hypothetical protein
MRDPRCNISGRTATMSCYLRRSVFAVINWGLQGNNNIEHYIADAQDFLACHKWHITY